MTTDEDSKIVATALCKLLDLVDPNTVESLNFCNPLLFGDRKAPQAVVTKLSQILPIIKAIPNVPQLNFITKLPTENQQSLLKALSQTGFSADADMRFSWQLGESASASTEIFQEIIVMFTLWGKKKFSKVYLPKMMQELDRTLWNKLFSGLENVVKNSKADSFRCDDLGKIDDSDNTKIEMFAETTGKKVAKWDSQIQTQNPFKLKVLRNLSVSYQQFC